MKKPIAVWVTGIPGSGKSTIAKKIAKKLKAGYLRLDDIRKVITPKPTYSGKERKMVYKALALIASKVYEKGSNVVIDATDNLNIGRPAARKLIRNFHVVQLKCPVAICEKREMKRKDKAGMFNLYKKARKGKIKLPGFGGKYIEEKKPLIKIETDKVSADLAVKLILAKLK